MVVGSTPGRVIPGFDFGGSQEKLKMPGILSHIRFKAKIKNVSCMKIVKSIIFQQNP